MLKFNIRLSKL